MLINTGHSDFMQLVLSMDDFLKPIQDEADEPLSQIIDMVN